MTLTSKIGCAAAGLLLTAAGLLLTAGGSSVAADKDAAKLPNGAVRQFGQDAPRKLSGACDDGCFAVAFSPDGTQIATGHGREARRWDVASGRLLHAYPNPRGTVHATAFSPDGTALALGGYANSFVLYGLKNGRKLAEPAVGVCVGFYLDFSADGKQLLADSGGGRGNRWDEVLLWDLATQKVLQRYRVDGVCKKARITPDGKTVVSGDSHGKVTAFDADTGKVTWSQDVEGGGVLDLQLTKDGERVVAVSSYPVPYVTVMNLKTGKELIRIPHKETVRAIAVSPDGSTIASAGNKSGILLFDVRGGARVGELAGHAGGVSSLAFSPDGRNLLSGGFRGRAILWEVPARP